LLFAGEPGCWRRFNGAGGQVIILKPDAFVRLAVGVYEVNAFIELDLDTESLPTIARKLDVHVAYWRSGLEAQRHGVVPKTWWLVPDAGRLATITRTIQRLPREAQALFTVCLASEAAELLIRLPVAEGGVR
jgi:hypothetical protein